MTHSSAAATAGAIYRLAGHDEMYQRLTNSLVVDAGALRGLGWRPAVDTREGLAALMR